MSLLKQIEDKGAVLEWSPIAQHANLVALGTKDSAGSGFDDVGGELELHLLDLADAKNPNSTLLGKARANSRFSSIAWSQMAINAASYPQGLIAGGMADGYIHVWDPSKISSESGTAADGEDLALLASVEQHQGSVSGLHFNPHTESSHLLASGGSDAEVFVTSLEHPDSPSVFIPAPPPNNAKHTADVTKVAWNTQVAHILASAAQNGSCFIWDLRQKKAWCELRDPSGGSVSDVAWNPDQGLHVVTASGDDKNPVIKLWDLRSSTSLPLATLQGHTQGVLSVSWCPSDPSLLLSCGKDNRTILWDLFQLQPVYDLPNEVSFSGDGSRNENINTSNAMGGAGAGGAGGSSSGMFFGGGLATNAGQRRFNVSWSPCLPAVIATSSFDRKIQFFSMVGAKARNGRAPKWLRRPVGASFGFGGKLVSFDALGAAAAAAGVGSAAAAGSKKAGGSGVGGRVKIHQVEDDTDLVAASDRFHNAIAKGEYKQFCESMAVPGAAGVSEKEREVWSLMNVICFGSNAREELLTHLGFDSSSISATAQQYVSSLNSAKLRSRSKSADGADAALSVEPAAEPVAAAVTVTGDLISAEDAFGAPAPAPADTTTSTSTSSGIDLNGDATPVTADAAAARLPPVLTPPDPAKTAELWEIIQAGEAAEPTIRRAIIVGNFEAAVECCLEAGLMAEALLLAQCGDQALRVRTQAAFFEKRRHQHPFLNVLHAVIRNELMNYVVNSDLLRWKETLALLSTYGKSEEFPSLCEALAGRLETEAQDTSSATLCYMCAANVLRTVKFWTDELIAANAACVGTDVDTVALQQYVEKVVVFTQANPVDSLGPECASFFAKYAALLANQGRLNVAISYLKGVNVEESILIDRLYHAGEKPAGSRPPPFPFEKVTVQPQQATGAVTGSDPVGTTAAPAAGVATQPAAAATGATGSRGSASASAAAGSAYGGGGRSSVGGRSSGGNAAAFAALNAANAAASTSTTTASAAAATSSAGGASGPGAAVGAGSTQQPGLPPGWLQLIDPASNHPYYVNQATGESQWEPPAPQPSATAPAPAPMQQPAAATMPTAAQTQPSVMPMAMPAASSQPAATAMPAGMGGIAGVNISNPNPTPTAAAAAPPEPAVSVAVPSEPVDMSAIDQLGQIIDSLAAQCTAPAEKKQVTMIRSAFAVLQQKAAAGQVAPDVMQKVAHLAECLASRNFVGANQIQTDLANTAWNLHKDWIKGLKILNQIAAKK